MKQTIEEVNQLINNQEFDARDSRIMTAHQRAFNQCFEYNRQVNQNHGYNLELLTTLFIKLELILILNQIFIANLDLTLQWEMRFS